VARNASPVTTQTIPEGRTEPRWPAILAVLVVFALANLLPSHYQFGPKWFTWGAVILILAVMVVVTIMPRSVLWHRIERAVVLTFGVIICGMNIAAVLRLVGDMISHKHNYSSVMLLESATVIWTVNILLFALLYWELDRAGPEARAAGEAGSPDFRFPESEEAAPGWQPHFGDYLFLAFATSTSFMAPDYSRPASRRAKGLLMLQSGISLTTLFLIASRAIATLS